MACHLRPLKVYMIKRHRVWHVIIALGQQTWSDHVGRGMPARPLGDTYGHKTLGKTCHYRLCDTHTNDVGCDMTSLTLSSTHGRMTLGVACHQSPRPEQTVWKSPAGMQSFPLDITYSCKMSSVSCYRRLWTSHTVERRQAWHPRMFIGQQQPQDDIGQGIPSSPLDNKQRLDDVVHDMLSLTLNSTHGQMTSSVTCHHHRFYEKCLLTH